MKVFRRGFLAIGFLGLLPGLAVAAEGGDTDDVTVRWDIVRVSGGILRAGGVASAMNNIGTTITLTGSGTFVPGEPDEVTGGGDFKIVDTAGHVLQGTYKVTRLISFERAPGTLPASVDQIGNAQEAGAGLAFLRIRYSDGRRGVLVVSCHLVGTPDFVFEGITASRSISDFWNREAPQDGVEGNRTVFHFIPEQEEQADN